MILNDIKAATKKRVEKAKRNISLSEIRDKAINMPIGNFRFENALRTSDIAFICEVKRASPSKGIIVKDFSYIKIAREYEAAGASAISVLTEPDFFQGSNIYLSEIKQVVKVPLLRKDFIVDEYQIYESKVIGAEALLLITSLLDTDKIRHFLEICECLGISALVEAHTKEEIESAVEAGAKIIGVNNRDLKTFEVNFTNCIHLRSLVPAEIIYVAESGIKTSEDIALLRKAGVNAVLIGETFMRSHDKKAMLQELKGANL